MPNYLYDYKKKIWLSDNVWTTEYLYSPIIEQLIKHWNKYCLCLDCEILHIHLYSSILQKSFHINNYTIQLTKKAICTFALTKLQNFLHWHQFWISLMCYAVGQIFAVVDVSKTLPVLYWDVFLSEKLLI